MKIKLDIRSRLPLTILASLAILLGISSLFAYYKVDDIINDLKHQYMEEIASTTGDSVNSQIYNASNLILLTANLTSLADHIDLPEKWAATEERMGIERYLEHIKRAHGYYDSLRLINSDGYVLAGDRRIRSETINVAQEPWFKFAMQTDMLIISDPIIDFTKDTILLPVTLKIVHDAQSALVSGMLRINRLVQTILIGNSTPDVSIYLMNSGGEIVSALNSNALGKKILGDELSTVLTAAAGSLDGLVGNDGDVIGFYHIAQTELYVIAVGNRQYLETYAKDLHYLLMGMGFLILIVMGIIVVLLIFPVVRDIQILSSHSEKIARGDRDVVGQLSVQRDDELGLLASNLDNMAVELNTMAENAEFATKTKSDFLAKMSHEIRTPMNGIIGMASLALMDNPEPAQAHYLYRIESAANNLLGIINDILDFSKIEANKLDLKIDETYIAELFPPLQDLLASRINEKKLIFDVIIDENVPEVIFVDSVRMSQICLNLCNNALKFTEKGSISIKVSLKERVGDDITLLVAVEDTGIGIPENAQATLFESFSQVDDAYSRKVEGTGLGLSICKSLVELMGGNIWVESVYGKGSVFYFTSQLQVGNLQGMKKKPTQQTLCSDLKTTLKEIKIKPLHILLVEDNIINQEIACAIFKKTGMRVSVAQNGQEAVNMWNDSAFDIIFMDIQMPIMDGYTATAHIRQTEKGCDVPIIAMTANALSGDREKSLDAGMTEHITKPINIQEILRILTFWSQKLK